MTMKRAAVAVWKPKTTIPFMLAVSLLALAGAFAAPFTCSNVANDAAATTTTTCQSLIGYVPANATTLAALKSLFQVPNLSLLGANALPPSTTSSHTLPAGATVRIPLTCSCAASGNGTTAGGPFYVVRPGDGLDQIARQVFDGMVTFQQIAEANGIKDPNLIEVGQKLQIPLPCGCGAAAGEPAVHLAEVVGDGSTVSGIAAEFGVEESLLMKINGIANPKDLVAGQILDVPLQACSSAINKNSPDYGMLVPNGSYALTAGNCVLCSCAAPSYRLACRVATRSDAAGATSCPAVVPKCGSLFLGNETTSGCVTTACAYTGYTNTTAGGLRILTNTSITNSCPTAPAPSPAAGSPPPAGGGGNTNGTAAARPEAAMWKLLLVTITQAALVSAAILILH